MKRIPYLFLLVGLLQSAGAQSLFAQRVRFSNDIEPVNTQTSQFQPASTTVNQPPGGVQGGVQSGTQGWHTIPPYTGPVTSGNVQYNGAPAATITPPNFDGFNTQPGISLPGNQFPPAPAYPGQPGFTGNVQPMIAPPGGSTGLPSYNPNPPFRFPTPNFPQVNPPSLQMPQLTGPSTWFDGFQWPSFGGGFSDTSQDGSRDWIGRSFWSKFEKGPHLNLFQEFRFGQTYLNGHEGNQLQMNDTEVGTTLNFPNFLASGEPLRISPGFVLHLWDGPSPPPATMPADLPPRAYSAFLATDWSSPTDRPVGMDINFSIGLYTGFETVTTDSILYKGTGLGRLRIAPDVTMRFGVTYLDRLEYKLLPAFGFFWTPTEDARMELFFPYPKISRRLQQVGNADVWTYLRAELGGDTYTIKRADGTNDQVDIVDNRILTGIEWNGYQSVSGFFEVGYVFNRGLFYRRNPGDDISLDDTFMVRTGFSF